MIIVKQDLNGIKPLLQVGELGYDNFPTAVTSDFLAWAILDVPVPTHTRPSSPPAGKLSYPNSPTCNNGFVPFVS